MPKMMSTERPVVLENCPVCWGTGFDNGPCVACSGVGVVPRAPRVKPVVRLPAVDRAQVISEAVRQLDGLDTGDPEAAHGEADQILLRVLQELGAREAVEAYWRVQERSNWWSCG